MLIQIVALYKAELDIRALMAWGHLQRALASFGIGGPETLAADLKAFMGEIIENEAASLFEHVSSSSSFRNARTRIIDPGQPLQEAKAHALRKVGGEIDLYVAALERAREPAREGSGNQINVFGQAIVQTGDFSLASMTVSLDENSKTEIVAALEAVKSALREAGDAPFNKEEVLELIEDAKSEVGEAEPNMTRLKGALLGIATTIQSVAALRPAYDTLKGALALVGISLP
jgi:hypothetical protein